MGAKALSESKNLPNLETLVLIHNDVNEGVQALFKDNENFPKLKDVYFYKAKAEV
jgi:Leucine-rich repeat (LRR) protein